MKIKNIENNALIEHISLLSHKESYTLINSIFDLEEYKLITLDHLYNHNKDIFIKLNSDILSTQIIEDLIKSRLTNNIEIYCIKKPNNHRSIENISIKYIEITTILDKIKEKNIHFDKIYKYKKSPKINLKSLLCIVLSKSKSRSYFMYGLILLFASLLTPYTIYYIIFSSILIIMSILCRFNLFKN